jgi:DNA-binding MarR family transcriptional regulator
MAANQGQHNAPLHVLVAAVTAAERGEAMPTAVALAQRIGCVSHGVTMAFARLERAGVLQRIGGNGRKRILVVGTGAMTAAAEAGE